MNKALIKIAYKQIIDAASQTDFEKNVFHASYNEFLLKSQAYNPGKKFKTFSELKANDGRANSLHYKSGFAAAGFINNLNKQIPCLHDTHGRSISFITYTFEIIESGITDKSKHKIAIIYFTGTFALLEVIGDYLLLATGDQPNDVFQKNVEAFLLKMQPDLSIVSYQSLEQFMMNEFINDATIVD